MDPRLRSHLISAAILLASVLLSGIFFFLHWALKGRFDWAGWLMPLSYATFLGGALIAFLVQFGLYYRLPRRRVVGFMLVIAWVAASLLSTLLETLTIVSKHMARGISYLIVIGGFFALVIPGFLLILLPWPPRFLQRRPPPTKSKDEEQPHQDGE